MSTGKIRLRTYRRWVAPGDDLSDYAVLLGGLYKDLNLRKRQVFRAWKSWAGFECRERRELAMLHVIALRELLAKPAIDPFRFQQGPSAFFRVARTHSAALGC